MRSETKAKRRAPPRLIAPEVRAPRTSLPWRPYAVCCALYLLPSFFLYGHLGTLASSISGYGTADGLDQIWWLAWDAHNVSHVSNLFFATGQNYPFGANFGDNGSMLALGILFTPITKLFGVIVTWNLALVLAPAVSAASMCFVLRRWTTWWPAAFIGGLLYGFSPYQTHLPDYLFLVFVPLPPLFFLFLHEILVRQKWSPMKAGLLLGLVCVVQFFIFTEILAGMVLIGAILVVLYVLTHPRAMLERWRYTLSAFGYGIGFAALLLAYPLAFTFAGPAHVSGAPDASIIPMMQTDVYGSVWPYGMWLGTSGLAGMKLTVGAASGQIYIGVPLLVILALLVITFRKNRTILFAAMMACIAFVLSLGTHPWVNGRATGIFLPFGLLSHLPALNGLLATRLSLYTSLFIAAVIAMGADEAWKRARARDRRLRRRNRNQLGPLSAAPYGIAGIVAACLLAVLVIVPWIPAQRGHSVATEVPTFFASSRVDAIPEGSALLAYPYPDFESFASSPWILGPKSSIYLDQAVAGTRFQLIGGYGWYPEGIARAGTTTPAVLTPFMVQALFDVGYLGGTPAERNLVQGASRTTIDADLRAFLHRYHVGTVLFLHLGHWRPVASSVTSAIGPPVESGGVTVWLHVQQRLSVRHH